MPPVNLIRSCSWWMCVLIGCLLEKRAVWCAQWSFISFALLLRTAPGPQLICTSPGCHGSPRKTALRKCELTNKSDFRHSCSAAHLLEKVGQWLQREAGGVLLALSHWGAFRKEDEVVFRRGAAGVRSWLFPSGNCMKKESDRTVTWCNGSNDFRLICTVFDQGVEDAHDKQY